MEGGARERLPMLSVVAWHLPAASAGLGGGVVAGGASGLALAGPAAETGPSPLQQAGISRRTAMLCAAALGLLAGLSGGVALMIWAGQGPARASGLVALALACAAGALTFGGLALRR
jgi:hypothetical protein